MNIGIDIDNTMYHLDVIEHVSKLFGLSYKSEDVKHWVYDKQRINGFPKYFTDIVYAYFDNSEYMGNLKIYDGVKDKLIKWKKDGHELYVISARKPSVHIATIQMLNRDFGVGFFNSIQFVEHKTNSKLDLFKNLDVSVDDNPKDLENACYIGLKVYAINNKYTKYNDSKVNECIQKYNNCTKVGSIGEIKL